MNRVCVFVDGENFRHSIVRLFKSEFREINYLPRQAAWTQFFERLACAPRYGGLRVRTYWYVVRAVSFWPYSLNKLARDPSRLRTVLSKHPSYRAELDQITESEELNSKMQAMVQLLKEQQANVQRRFDGQIKVQDGIAAQHDAIEFRRSGVVRYNLFEGRLGEEKSVDVKLACDMASLKDIYDVAVIVSGDQDYVPAIELIKDYGKLVANVVFKERSGKLLPGGARELNRVTDTNIVIEHKELAEYLGFAQG